MATPTTTELRLGLIGGTGVHDAGQPAERITVETPWGDVEVAVARDGPLAIFFLNRHGSPGKPAHVVPHKANVDALARCRVDRVIALNSVGALHDGVRVPSLLVPDDYLDLRADKTSFFDDAPVHVDVSEAYCPEVRRALVAAGADADGGVYVATEGPRLETRAEVRMLAKLGGDVVGMTGCPEAALARERGLCYASLCLVTNFAAGVAGPVDAVSIREAAAGLAPRGVRVVRGAARALICEKRCGCETGLQRARL